MGHSPLFPTVEWGHLELSPPVLTLRDGMTLWVDDLRVDLIFVGPAHTTNDVVAWIPERRLLMAGDIAFNGGTPFVVMGSIQGSLEATARLRGLGAEKVVPGHGDVCGAEVFDDVEAYLRFVHALAVDAVAAGLTPLDAARQADLGPFSWWTDPERLAGNLHRAFSELRGEPHGAPIDLMAAFQDMVAWNGGNLPRCYA